MSDSEQAKSPLVSSLRSYLASRRSLLKGAVVGAAGATGLGAAGAALLPSLAVHAASPKKLPPCVDTPTTILSVARTAERLAITFYSEGIENAENLGLEGANLANIKAALVEEQIHELFFAANGGVAIASDFSFPQGPDTFKSLSAFIATQQQLEGVLTRRS